MSYLFSSTIELIVKKERGGRGGRQEREGERQERERGVEGKEGREKVTRKERAGTETSRVRRGRYRFMEEECRR